MWLESLCFIRSPELPKLGQEGRGLGDWVLGPGWGLAGVLLGCLEFCRSSWECHSAP